MATAIRVGSFLLAVVGCAALLSDAAIAKGDVAPVKRVIRIGVLNPTAGVAESQISTHEGEPALFKIDDVGSFKFVPTLPKNDDKTVLLTILDADSGRQIDQLHLSIGGKPAQPKGLPFQVKIIEVTTPR
ncbi:MAG TPA: hypothetical protein VKT80_08690 [Chloroflexota bacterium]|nr:hypothetical protein [Chloroflexota bacterium]